MTQTRRTTEMENMLYGTRTVKEYELQYLKEIKSYIYV